ncbi:unnamed protein product [Candida verbasci]|uniref:NAD-dependent epimerase/dehydratase domain-containing protein n=1 Tax=Candida verbasci TaxID=1227364 RepID=A0A9W4XC67_9ASCO|nr:unnamed protein product [Candida verbasci]
MSNSIFITGGSGYIGQHIIDQLINDGNKVIAIVRSETSGKKLQSLFSSSLTTEIIPDLLASYSLKSLFEKYPNVTTFINTAAIINFTSQDLEYEVINPNINLIKNILTQIKTSNINKVILTSSSAAMVGPDKAFGISGDYSDSDWSPLNFEMGKINANMAYFASKKFTEEEAWKIAKDAKFDLISICPALVLGPKFDANEEGTPSTTSIIAEILKLNKDDSIPEFAAGAVDVRDVAKIHSLAIKDGDFKGNRVLLEVGKAINQNMINVIKANFKELKDKLPDCESVPENYIGKPNDEKSKKIYKIQLRSIDESVKDLVSQLIEKK